MRVGVIGVGRMGAVHARTLTQLPAVDSVTLADVDPDRLAAVGADTGLPTSGDPEGLLQTSDAVVIAAATSAHAPLVHAAADAGVPTFCEKPLAPDLPSTNEVVEHVRRSGIPLQMGFQRRFDAGYRAARDLVSGGGIGSLYVVRMAGHDPEPPHEDYIPVSGGIFRDFSVHDFDALRFVTCREVEEVYADGSVIAFQQFATYDDVDTAVAVLRLEGGALGILSTTRHDPYGYDVRMELFGSGDSAVVGWNDRTPLRSLEPGMPEGPRDPYLGFAERFGPAYQAEIEAFVEVAVGRAASPCTADDALRALLVAEACDRSRREHRPVRIEEFGEVPVGAAP